MIPYRTPAARGPFRARCNLVPAEELQRLQSLLAGLRPSSSKSAPAVDLSDVLKGDRVIQAVKKNKGLLIISLSVLFSTVK